MSIDKVIEGDLIATTVGQMLSAGAPASGSAGYVAIERVSGSLHGREGTFALQHFGVMDGGSPTLTVQVIPGSGTGALAGLRGDFRIAIAEGVHSYTLEYTLPARG